ncbi:MAG: hypothetical protein RLY43_2497 [Bacteroidota bacterium]|jgi:hypothetical protein
MYYNEKWREGLFYVQTSPNGPWKLQKWTLAILYEGVRGGHISLELALDLAYDLGQSNSHT